MGNLYCSKEWIVSKSFTALTYMQYKYIHVYVCVYFVYVHFKYKHLCPCNKATMQLVRGTVWRGTHLHDNSLASHGVAVYIFLLAVAIKTYVSK